VGHGRDLDIAERGGITLEEVGEIMNLTRERIRQIEVRGLLKLRMASPSPEEVGAALLRRPGQ
jgi:DNA-directed RNA polymerase sigma subunit (sigma70/sigma32)